MPQKQRLHLTSMFEKYYLDVQRFVATKFGNSHDAEDVVQDAFQKIMTNTDIESIENPKAYLYQTANNLALNRIRSEQRRYNYESVANTDFEEERSPERFTFATSDLKRVEEVLQSLPEKYRRTFMMSRIDSKSYQEISDELGIAVSTVEKHIIKALSHLRQHMKEGETV